MLLVLSHGQATVKRGFSINKQVETHNIQEESVVAKRTICDYVSYVGRIQNIDVTDKKLILAATAARQKYSAYLNDMQMKAASDEKSKKRKAVQEEIDQLKKRNEDYSKMQRLWRKRQMTLLLQQKRNVILRALLSLTVCVRQRRRSFWRFSHWNCSWKISSSSARTNEHGISIK